MYDLIIVEDEDEVRNGLMEFFPWEKFGFHAVAAFDNGRAALEYCRKNKVDESYHSNELQWAQTFLRMKKKIHSLKR